MKVIFVDIDGPLATEDCGKKENTEWGIIYRMNPKCIEVFNDILKETNAEYVITSDWRKHFSLEELGGIFTWNGCIKKPIALTGTATVSMNGVKNRRHQIKLYLEENKPDKWVAFDDMNLGSNEITNFVLCDPIDGLCEKDIKESIIKFLN